MDIENLNRSSFNSSISLKKVILSPRQVEIYYENTYRAVAVAFGGLGDDISEPFLVQVGQTLAF